MSPKLLIILVISVVKRVFSQSHDDFWEYLKNARDLELIINQIVGLSGCYHPTSEFGNYRPSDCKAKSGMYSRLEADKVDTQRTDLSDLMLSDPLNVHFIGSVDDGHTNFTIDKLFVLALGQSNWKLSGVWEHNEHELRDRYSIYMFHQSGTDRAQWFVVERDGDNLDFHHIRLVQKESPEKVSPVELWFYYGQESVLKMHAKYHSRIDELENNNQSQRSQINALESELLESEKKCKGYAQTALMAGAFGAGLVVVAIVVLCSCLYGRRQKLRWRDNMPRKGAGVAIDLHPTF